eukprot:TRINITY_DN25265_c0_g1_i4.p1 TRINITY_DN25265_c0_g1~~TRINITY_DN25265_c0_g1_i4.p1  ORF type:complete len:145 (-),score=39.12 TRINITY_DN25265_c0_g1_i4:445-879(-)
MYFFFKSHGEQRDLHYPLRRQRQMCIRDRDSFVAHGEEVASVKFVVTVESEQHGRELVFECVATGGGEVELSEASVFDPEDHGDPDAYSNPKFDELSDELREAFQGFLVDNHVDAPLAGWIGSFAYHKEVEQYGEWLQKVKAIV